MNAWFNEYFSLDLCYFPYVWIHSVFVAHGLLCPPIFKLGKTCLSPYDSCILFLFSVVVFIFYNLKCVLYCLFTVSHCFH